MPETIVGKTTPPTANKAPNIQPDLGVSGLGKNIGGILGGTIGQIAGSVLGPGGTIAGGAGGGAIGGGLGEGVDELASGKGVDWHKILGASGEQGAYGAIPVGEEARAIPLLGKIAESGLGRAAIRGGAGFLGGGAAQVAQNAGDGAPLTQGVLPNATGTAIGSIASPLVGKVTELAGKTLALPGKVAFDYLPKSIQKSLDLTKEKLSNLETKKLSDLVGYKNIFKAGEWGIHPDMLPEQVLDTVTPHMEDLGKELNTHLSAEGAATTLQDVRDAFSKAQRQVAPGLKDVDMNYFGQRVDDFLRQNMTDEGLHPITDAPSGGLARNSAGTNPLFTNRTLSGQSTTLGPTGTDLQPIPLNIVNKIKQRVGKRFGDDPLYEQVYHNLQGLIEGKSGQPDIIKGINEEYNTLRDIKTSATKQLEKPTDTILNYGAMKKDLMARKLVDPTTATLASLSAGSAAIPGVGHIPALAGGGYALYRILNNAIHDPVASAKILSVLNKPGQLAQTVGGKYVKNATTTLGKGITDFTKNSTIRLPAEIMNLLSGQTNQ